MRKMQVEVETKGTVMQLEATTKSDEIGPRIDCTGSRPATLTGRKPAAPGRRSTILARLLADAASAAREYSQRWLAGRGAE